MTNAQQKLLEELFYKKANTFKKQSSGLVFKSEMFIINDNIAICLKHHFIGIGAPKVGDIFKSKKGDIVFKIEEKCADYLFSENLAGEIVSLTCLQFKVKVI